MAEPGQPLGARLLAAIARKDVQVRQHTLQMENLHKDAFITAWMERAERELAPVVQTMLGHLADNPAMPQRIRDTIKRGITPTHQVDFLLNLLLSVAAAVTQLGAFTAPVAQSEVNALWSQHTTMPLPANIAALAALRGAVDYPTAAELAAETGFGSSQFDYLYQSQIAPPPVESLLTMWRRGLISQASVVTGLTRLGVDVTWQDALLALKVGPPSAADAILGAVQNHLDAGTAQSIVAENGIDPSNYAWLYQNAGRPPGPMEMLSAWNRGVAGVDQSVVEQSVRESDIKDKYVPVIVGLREHLLPQKTVVAGVHQGVITDTEALAMLLKLGISATNAGYLIAEGHNLKTATHKNVAAGMIEAAYEDGSLARADAQSHLVALGYLAADADFILNLVDTKWAASLHAATVSKIRAEYTTGHLTRTVASSELDTAGVTAPHRDAYLAQWDIVKATPSRTLTEAQASNAYRRLLISQAEFTARLAAMGYNATDVALLIELTPRPLSQAQAIAGYVAGILTEAELRGYLTAEGLTTHDQDVLIAEHPLTAPPPA